MFAFLIYLLVLMYNKEGHIVLFARCSTLHKKVIIIQVCCNYPYTVSESQGRKMQISEFRKKLTSVSPQRQRREIRMTLFQGK